MIGSPKLKKRLGTYGKLTLLRKRIDFLAFSSQQLFMGPMAYGFCLNF